LVRQTEGVIENLAIIFAGTGIEQGKRIRTGKMWWRVGGTHANSGTL